MIAIVFISFFVVLFVGVPIGVAIGGMCLLSIILLNNPMINVPYIFQTMYTSMDSFVLLAIPLFTLSGAIMSKGGLFNSSIQRAYKAFRVKAVLPK